ncbi:MAG: MolR family transcriptional regulator [Planctomycetes bacterium]|nr:MolR family transcriptional regulator [Planctomycetota bacterium]
MGLFGKRKMAGSSEPRYYYDEPEIESSPETSHPKFVELVTDDFFYSCIDDFSPFGNDDGADGLRMLEEWFKDGGRPYGVINFLRDAIAGWALNVPQNLDSKTEKGMSTWLDKDHMHDRYLASDCRLRVATALGQLKICGLIDDPVLKEAKYGIKWMLFLNTRAAEKYPEWEHANKELGRIEQIKAVLDAYK